MNFRLFTYLSFILLLASCSTKKNTVVARGYHNLTARYNGYYYSSESIKDGVYKIEQNNKENYDKTLPVYVYPTPQRAKATFPEFDKAIKKSTTCIQRHAIKDSKDNEIPAAGKWIDNNWINIGIARFYKREFFSGIEAFEYVARTYSHSKDKYDAMVWLVKSYNEVGAVSNSEQILSLLKNEKKLPAHVKKELPALYADYYFRKGLLTEASSKLMEAANNRKLFGCTPRKKRARYSFIIAQMLEEQKDIKRARRFYEYTIRLKPNYEMMFYAKIKLARLIDVKRMDTEKTKKNLLKMAKETKNSDYFDVIYYTLGEIEEKESHVPKAMEYYKKSVATSTINPSQKALSYLKLGEINFELTQYPLAQAYYDSTLVTLPNEHPNYKNIVARQKTLDNLVSYLKTIKREDSLQKFAKLSDTEKEAMIQKIIKKMEEDEERAKEEKEKAISNAQSLGNNPVVQDPNLPINAASFYFYNQNTISFGIADFVKKWGNRKNEDNWRRSNKQLTLDDPNANDNSTVNPKDPKDKNAKTDPKKSKEYYLKNVPITDSLMDISHNKIIDAFYLLGSTYKEDLNNTKKSIAAFEELNARYKDHKYLLNTYYLLYKSYEQEKNAERAEFYKNKILNEYPNSEFAQMIKNPKYIDEKQSLLSDVEKDYNVVYSTYVTGNYQDAYSQSNAAIAKFGKNVYLPKFEFIRAMSLGKLKGVDSLEFALKQIVVMYPKSDVAPLSKDILESIKKQKNPEMYGGETPKLKVMGKDTFQINFVSEHFLLALCPDDPKIANGFKQKLDAFCKKYYSGKVFNIQSMIFGTKMQLIIVKTFETANEAIKFRDNVKDDKDVFKDEVKKELFTLMIISAENMPMFYSKKNVMGYQLFYDDNYKSLDASILSDPTKLK